MAETYTPTPVRNTAYTAVEDGDNLDAASVRPMLEGLADHGAWAGGEVDGHETRLDGHDTAIAAANAAIATKGGLGTGNTWTGINGFQNHVTFSGETVRFLAGTMMRRPPIVDLVDTGSQTIGPEDGWLFRIPLASGTPRRIILRQSGTPTIQQGMWLRVFFPNYSIGSQWAVRREGEGFDLVHFDNTGAAVDLPTFAEFQFEGGIWRLSEASGHLDVIDASA